MFDFLRPAWRSKRPERRQAARRRMSAEQLYAALTRQRDGEIADELLAAIDDPVILARIRDDEKLRYYHLQAVLVKLAASEPAEVLRFIDRLSYKPYPPELICAVVGQIKDDQLLSDFANEVFTFNYRENTVDTSITTIIRAIAARTSDLKAVHLLAQRVAGRFLKKGKAVYAVWEFLKEVEPRITPTDSAGWVSFFEEVSFPNEFSEALCASLKDPELIIRICASNADSSIKSTAIYQLADDDTRLRCYREVPDLDAPLRSKLIRCIRGQELLLRMVDEFPKDRYYILPGIRDAFLKSRRPDLFAERKASEEADWEREREERARDDEIQRAAWEADRYSR